MKTFRNIILISLIFISTNLVYSAKNECNPNPCVGECEICVVNTNIRCIRAPCPQYECHRNETCLSHQTGDLPKHKNCSLPLAPGNCLAYNPQYFFNTTSKQCEDFVYGGCDGNGNRFSTELHCERVCILGKECPKVKLSAPPKGCRYDQTPGPDGCPNNKQICDVRGGSCPAVSNRTSDDSCVIECSNDNECNDTVTKCCKIGCNKLCLSPVSNNNKPNSGAKIVRGVQDECKSNPCVGECETCVINRNIVCKKAPCPQYQCQRNESCFNQQASDVPKNKNCSLPVDPGMCLAYFPKFFFNTTSKKCEKFIYGGCNGNGNKFLSELHCDRVCIQGKECPMFKLIAPKKGCRYDQTPGPDGCPTNKQICDVRPGLCPTVSNLTSNDSCMAECSNDSSCRDNATKCCVIGCNKVCLSPLYNDDPSSEGNNVVGKEVADDCTPNPCAGKCETCVINPNIRCIRAPCPQYECQTNETCLEQLTSDVPRNQICSLSVDPGNCLAYFPKYFFNVTSKQCENFIYGGCGGNENRFSTELHCERVCVLGRECPMVKLPAPPKGCRYDQTAGPDGCPTNKKICDVKPGSCPSLTNKTIDDACMVECSNDGDCEDSKMKCCIIGCNRMCLSPAFIDNESSSQSENESSSQSENESSSEEEKSTEIRDLPKNKNCLLPKQQGMCEAAIEKYYFDTKTMECEKFIFGGCGGNANKFSTEEECERICIAGKECPKIRLIPPPEGCRFSEENGDDGCPMRKLVCDVKPGLCPHSTMNISKDICTTECAHDGDCADDKKCCNIECNSVCLQPEKKIITKSPNSGQCPSFEPQSDSMVGVCAIMCSNDGQCKSGEKCCKNQCGGFTCMKPSSNLPVRPANCTFKPLPMPPVGCRYVSETGSDSCPNFKLVCSNNSDPCASNPCKPDGRCAVIPCFVAPCTEYQCLPIRSEPACENSQCSACEACVRTPLMCLRAPCQPYICQNACGECSTCGKNGTCQPMEGAAAVACTNDICKNRQCQKFPEAKCFIDKCNCERYLFRLPNNKIITHGQCESV